MCNVGIMPGMVGGVGSIPMILSHDPSLNCLSHGEAATGRRTQGNVAERAGEISPPPEASFHGGDTSSPPLGPGFPEEGPLLLRGGSVLSFSWAQLMDALYVAGGPSAFLTPSDLLLG